jgi:hypothetical protein
MTFPAYYLGWILNSCVRAYVRVEIGPNQTLKLFATPGKQEFRPRLLLLWLTVGPHMLDLSLFPTPLQFVPKFQQADTACGHRSRLERLGEVGHEAGLKEAAYLGVLHGI